MPTPRPTTRVYASECPRHGDTYRYVCDRGCIVCNYERRTAYVEAHPDKKLEDDRRWKAENRDLIRRRQTTPKYRAARAARKSKGQP